MCQVELTNFLNIDTVFFIFGKLDFKYFHDCTKFTNEQKAQLLDCVVKKKKSVLMLLLCGGRACYPAIRHQFRQKGWPLGIKLDKLHSVCCLCRCFLSVLTNRLGFEHTSGDPVCAC